MSVNLSRRTVLEGAAAAWLLSVAGVARSATRQRLLTITYPAGASIRFDADYYRDHHLKLFMDIYGSAIERFELRTLAPGGAFSAVINIWIADFEQFRARSTPAAYQRMGDDKKNFTNTSSSIQVDEVTCESGDPRSRMTRGCECLSLLYPAGPAGAWSDDAKCRAYVDGLKKLLGRETLRRVELRKGLEQLDDGAPAYQGGINLYSRNTLSPQNREAVVKMSAQLCSVAPVELSTTVFGTSDV